MDQKGQMLEEVILLVQNAERARAAQEILEQMNMFKATPEMVQRKEAVVRGCGRLIAECRNKAAALIATDELGRLPTTLP